MKTFFLALILGIFVGSIITNYFADPDAYERLKEAKSELFESPLSEESATAVAETAKSEPAMFEVGSGKFDTEKANAKEPAKPLPIPLPKPKKEQQVAPETAAPKTEKTNTDALIEQGAKKAGEIADTVAEKAKEVAKDAQPMIENGIDLTIATAIRAQYKLERRIDSDAIKIAVKDNIVTLSGAVDSAATKQLAIEIAVFTKGVSGVEETLSIAE